MDISSIASALSSLKAAKDIAQSLLELKNAVDIQSRVIELQGAILTAQGKTLDAQAEQFEMQKLVSELETKLKQLSDQKEFVSRLKRQNSFYFADGDPDPFCPRCVEVNWRPVHLVKTTKLEMRLRIWACPECKNEFPWRPE